MKAVLFYIEDEEATRFPQNRQRINRWCAMAGLEHLMIDKTGALRKTNKNVFDSVADAMACYADHTFVFLSEKTDRLLSEFNHPIDNVIYCIGSDEDGFQDEDEGQLRFRLPTTHQRDTEWYATDVVPIVIADIMVRG